MPRGGKNNFGVLLINLNNDFILKVLNICDHLQKKSTEKDHQNKSYGFSKLATSERYAHYFGGLLKIFHISWKISLIYCSQKNDHSGPCGLGVVFYYMLRYTKPL